LRLLSAVIILIAGCGAAISESAQAPSTRDPSVTILVVRRPTRSLFAEYSRELVLRKKGVDVAHLDLQKDTGGYSEVKLYIYGDGTLYAVDAFGNYLLDPCRGTIVTVDHPRPGGELLGSFREAGKAKTFSFVRTGDSST
jgi:hypothetical protein